MTNEQIQQWAREAGLTPPFLCGGTSAISDFAALVRNAALEEAAVKCETTQKLMQYESALMAKEIRSLKA